ncbi:hypothetical protein [Streptomyces fulvoviolaceus]|uniref:hypothetical protein n=1 Tax=Streptomyces fulvoviolaceus TaxID=285535 RepID=UPI0021C02951|nr:hypothetical protein [Streptomyces fulvoviolaceus]MCT9075060.1 hypothetical protein [Streptomyces fulvoviolaceus]
MTRPPARTHLTASVLALCTLLGTTACSALSSPPTAEQAPIVPTTSAPPKSPTSSPAAAGLTAAQAQAALVTDADLGEPWTPTQGAATWRDGLLKAKTKRPDCQRLLDALYADDLFGADAQPRAVVGLDDEWNEAQLRYQVVARKPADVDRTLAWLKTLPKKCGQFAARTVANGVQGVQVTDSRLPKVGDGRQGLLIMMTGESPDGEPTTLTLDVAAVRVGDDAIGLTNGGLGDVMTDATRTAVQLGAERLKEIRKQARVQV